MAQKEEKMKKVLLIGTSIWLLASLLISPQCILAAEPGFSWKLNTPFIADTLWFTGVQMWADDVSKMSGGRMKIELIGSAFGADILGAVQQGTREAGYSSPAFLTARFPAAALFGQTPAFLDFLGFFTWMQAYGGKELLQDTFGNAAKIFPVGMAWAKTGAWANKKIEALSDFRGFKYANAAELKKILTDAGATIMPLGPYEIFGSIQAGTIDGGEFSTPYQDMVSGLHKVAKHCYFPGIQTIAQSFVLMVNNGKWDSLPPDLKEIVKGACDTAMVRSLTQWMVLDVRAVQALKDAGKVTILKYSREMQQEILDRLIPQYDANPDPMFQKVWKSQKEFIKVYVPYMKLQQLDAEVKLK
jgi:TRAP-type mannitol/chloroaromatic compound transport system substrate-binding protein